MKAWHARMTAFQAGQWMQLLEAAGATQTQANTDQHQPSTTTGPTEERQARRPCQLVHQGQFSAARQALTASAFALGTDQTLQQLWDPVRRPTNQYPAPAETVQSTRIPHPDPDLPANQLLTNLRRAREGAAPGPSGLTAETLRFVLDDEHTTQSFITVASQIAKAEVPRDITKALGLGRLVALQKPHGNVRAIIVGDLLRRLVARCLAQTYAEPIAAVCHPPQFALSTGAGAEAEAVAHSITAAVQHSQVLTILSIDGVGGYDTISRRSMLTALCAVPGANRCSNFVNMFYSEPSTYVWHDQHGNPHTITQAEGGEQGGPLMPALFSLGQRAALHTVQAELQDGENLFAFIDDIYVLVPPNRVRPVYDLLSHHLFTSAQIRLTTLSHTTSSRTTLYHTIFRFIHTTLSHTRNSFRHNSHRQLRDTHTRTQPCDTHTHKSLTHNSFTHNSLTYNSLTHSSFTHTQLSHVQHSNSFTRTTLSHTHNSLTRNSFTHNCGMRGAWWHRRVFCVAGVALAALECPLYLEDHSQVKSYQSWPWANQNRRLYSM